MRVNWHSGVPRFEQVKSIIRQFIAEQGLQAGAPLPSEREWANRLGVSQMTVNRALKELAQEGLIARSVGKGTFVLRAESAPVVRHALVLVFPFAEIAALTQQNIYYGPILQGVLSALAETNCTVQFWKMGFDQLGALPADGLRQRAFLVFAPLEDTYPALQSWWEMGIPFVVVGASWPTAQLPCVDTDNFAAAQRVVDFLVSMGHRRIALLTGQRTLPNNRDRWDGFVAAMQQHGLTVPENWLIEVDSSAFLTPSGAQRLQAILSARPRPTALFAAGYYLAAEAMRLVKRAGLQVPRDLSIVGFDDPPSANYLEPPLTTVSQPLVELGRRAVFKLLAMLNGQIQPAVEKLPAELIVRASVASPKRP